MPRNNDTLFRQWFMLTYIPRFPKKIGTADIKKALEGEGYDIDVRSIQRDLIKLSAIFPLNYDMEGRKNCWYWIKDAATESLPGMDPATAISFVMAESYLTSLLPGSTLELLAPYFRRSREVLEGAQESNLQTWPSKIAVVPRGLQLKPPSINTDVQNTIYQGLLNERVLEFEYKAKSATKPTIYEAHPLGIVVRDSLIYLVCTLWKYKDILQLPLHRMISVELTDTRSKSPKGFQLRNYIYENQGFSYPIDSKPINLEVIFSYGAAQHLYETPLTDNQTLETLNDGKVLLKASIIDTHELRWWLQGFGSQVEVIATKELRSYFTKNAHDLAKKYEHD